MFTTVKFEYKTVATVKPEQIWPFYEDPAKWPLWDKEIERVAFDGPFTAGTTGTLKPYSGPEGQFVITEMTKNRSYSTTTFLPLTKLIFTHTITPKGDQFKLSYMIEMKGFLAPIFAILVGRKIKQGLPGAIAKLVQLAGDTTL